MTKETPTLVGRIPEGTGRKPKTTDRERMCTHRGCTTKLSRYNNKDVCFQHRPPRFPRVRGRPH